MLEAYDIFDEIYKAPEEVLIRLQRVLGAKPNELALALLPVAVHLALRHGAMAKPWNDPLPKCMSTVYYLQASQAALEGHPVGSYAEFCAEVVASSSDAESLALQALFRCKPADLSMPEYLAALSGRADSMEFSDDGAIPYYERRRELEAGVVHQVKRIARAVADYLRMTEEPGEGSTIATLLFLDDELTTQNSPLPEEVADELFIRAVRNAVLCLHELNESLITPSAITRATHVAHRTLIALAKKAGAVLRPIEDRDTPVMKRSTEDKP